MWSSQAAAEATSVRLPAALLGHVIESLADGVVIADLEGHCLLSNPAARRLLGEDVDTVPAAQWPVAFSCFLPDMTTPCPPAEMPLGRALLGEIVTDLVLFVRAGSPQAAWLSINATPIRDHREQIVGGVIVLRDVSVLKRKMQQIELLSNVVEATADAVIVTDPKGRIEYVNPAFESTTGYTRDEVVGRNSSLLESGAHTREFYAEAWAALAEGQVVRQSFVSETRTGARIYSDQTITPMRTAGAITHLVSVGKDVTQLRRAAERESTLLLARSVQTDGVTDCGPPDGDFFGAQRAIEIVAACSTDRSAEVVDQLLRAVEEFEQGEPQRDDVTTVVVRRLAVEPRQEQLERNPS